MKIYDSQMTCVYVDNTIDGYLILCLYINDILIIGSHNKMISKNYDMKGLT